ncbi:ATP-binding protein [Fictibacillus aquaticus]|uniref:histidine kinase n=1 Tax=Fictibacillus aquaticus TaxID=2021314 RepID=A0A235FDN6_9BACL|nr:HAMP domain-containing sensor histidine kinase [Fictibacillus aquaticus]OYD59468.1 two-component sensor histidine kinase [Fictibacillus aquaticus]
MSAKQNQKRISLLRFWTTRYFATLCIGLIVIGTIAALWIRHAALQNRLELFEFMAEEAAAAVASHQEGRFQRGGGLPGLIKERERFLGEFEKPPTIFVLDLEGGVLFSNLPRREFKNGQTFPAKLLKKKKTVQQVKAAGTNLYVVKKPITSSDGSKIGYVAITQTKEELTKVNQEYRLLAVMLLSLAVLGWLAIYYFSRKVSRPLQQVAEAAARVRDGNYSFTLPDDVQEKEVYELVHAFQDMAERLQLLESMRAELLAGVTHELKTPVTAVSGLMQAIRDGVVKGKDADDFIAASLTETDKMQKMVEDLLDFNSFTANAVPVKLEQHNVLHLLQEIIHQWELVNSISVQLKAEINEGLLISTDSLRLQQIIVNLLNNAKHACDESGEIEVRIHDGSGKVIIDVTDHGSGIPDEEQDMIFERFYRGKVKKYKVRGLGLGLPFSKLLAEALDGELMLERSEPGHTNFRVLLPKY